MKTLYLDIFSGLSGDMFIGALLDLGVEFRTLRQELLKLGLPGYHLHVSRRQKSGIEGVKFDVHPEGESHHHDHDDHHDCCAPDHGDHAHDHTHGHSHSSEHHHHHADSRDFAVIRRMIDSSSLSPWVRERSIAVFRRIAEAEGKVHGLPPDQVHFHEVGAVDSIVDIVGSCIGLEQLGRPRVLAGAVVEGTGWVRCAHGRFPIPTAATLEILGARGIPLTQCEEPHELVTPTGAALLAEFAESFGPMRNLVASRVGYGLGTRDNQTRPNVVRAVLGDEAATEEHDWETDSVVVLETNLDDVSGEILGEFIEGTLPGRGARRLPCAGRDEEEPARGPAHRAVPRGGCRPLHRAHPAPHVGLRRTPIRARTPQAAAGDDPGPHRVRGDPREARLA